MIARPYLLVLNMPLHRHTGEYWAEPLWRKDLEAHCVGIADLRIACPVEDRPPLTGWEPLSQGEIVVHPLPAMRRWSLAAAPLIAARLWRAIAGADIVHTGVAGWPFPLGWLAVPIARLRRKFLVLVVESAFWRVPPGVTASPLRRAKAAIFEALNKACIRRCDVTFFTTEAYRTTLNPDGADSHVLPAVWVDESRLIEPDDRAALLPNKATRLLFAGRLTTGKGVDVLLDAITRSGVPVDFVGDGDLSDAVAAAAHNRPDLIRLIEPVDYGEAFSRLLDDYAALIVPTITDEQPRVIYDAFARGVPALASDTSGNRQIVEHKRNGWLYPAGDSAALADVLLSASQQPAALASMGAGALGGMASHTHAAMHAARADIITEAFTTRSNLKQTAG